MYPTLLLCAQDVLLSKLSKTRNLMPGGASVILFKLNWSNKYDWTASFGLILEDLSKFKLLLLEKEDNPILLLRSLCPKKLTLF